MLHLTKKKIKMELKTRFYFYLSSIKMNAIEQFLILYKHSVAVVFIGKLFF